jgi:hypothetical protein
MEVQHSQVVHSFSKNETEKIQIALKKYKGKYFVDFRIWFESGEKKILTPTTKGVFFSLNHLSDLSKGLEELYKVAETLAPEEDEKPRAAHTYTARKPVAAFKR